MGSSFWNDDFYRDRETTRTKTGTSAFAYNASLRSAPAHERVVHAQMNPHKVTRESRDSAEHPDSVAVAVVFDVTGSMGSVPVVLQKKLPQLMQLLVRKSYVKDPQVLFGAVGDTRSDKGSFQVGQFESGIEMDDDLGRMWIEGGGGGSCEESYQNALYFFARHTSLDCVEKRNQKGYLFIIGDEKPYPKVSKGEVERLFGDTIEKDLTLAEVISEARTKYNVFFVIPTHTSHGRDPVVQNTWIKALGQENVLMLDDAEAVCEAIAGAIGLCEGTANLESAKADLKEAGASAAVVNSVATALGTLAKSTAAATPAVAKSFLDTAKKAEKTVRL